MGDKRFFSSGAGGGQNYKVCRRLHKEEGGWMVRPPGGF